MDKIVLATLLVQYYALMAWYAATGQWTKAMYWLGATLLQVAIMRGLK